MTHVRDEYSTFTCLLELQRADFEAWTPGTPTLGPNARHVCIKK